jgi:hypothetical protein
MRGILEEIGYADACLARELPDGSLELVDGHMRQALDPEQVVPVLVLDLDDDEARKLMVSLDPLAGMAEADETLLGQLLAEITTDDAGLQALYDDLAAANHIDLAGVDGDPGGPATERVEFEADPETTERLVECPECGHRFAPPAAEVDGE